MCRFVIVCDVIVCDEPGNRGVTSCDAQARTTSCWNSKHEIGSYHGCAHDTPHRAYSSPYPYRIVLLLSPAATTALQPSESEVQLHSCPVVKQIVLVDRHRTICFAHPVGADSGEFDGEPPESLQ